MQQIKVDISGTKSFVDEACIDTLRNEALSALETVNKGTGLGNDFLGWNTLPGDISAEQIKEINETAKGLRDRNKVVVCIGIGGSYLGAKAVIEALSDTFAAYREDGGHCKVVFAGQNIGEDYLYELMDYLRGKKFGIIVISKSGTTTEPAIAFRLLKDMLEKQEGKKHASENIVAITDAKKGALRSMATTEGYKTFVIPDNVGGRFSVLTPVGLLPIATAGYDIEALVDGARQMQNSDQA
ncbi:MAG: glucose-6-phosphate isomerase, partial [Muribaculaceae bacterium]|nr:glucose-6-phosphate isomerase [Muribaculaceae bacterium]